MTATAHFGGRVSRERVLFARDVLDWVQERHPVRIAGGAAKLITDILERAPEFSNLTDLLAALGCPETTARFRMNKQGFPPPRAWYWLARALDAADHVRAHRDRSQLRLALELGYSDHSALHYLFRRNLGLRIAQVQTREGWEPLVAAWWEARRRQKRKVAA